MSPTKKWFAAMVVAAFLSIISFFQINSYFADKNNFNTGFTIIGIVLGLVAAYCLYRVSKGAGGYQE